MLLCPCLALAQSSPPPGAGNPPAPSDADRAKLEAEISKELGATPQPPSPGGAPQGGAASGAAPAPQGATGGNPLARLLLMPDISAIADFTGIYDTQDVARYSPDRGDLFAPKGKPTFTFQEVELGLQAVVDPYFRADMFISFTPDGVDVEEAYATTLSLPASLQIRAGKFFTPFGRMNQQHPHVWEFIDPPLARGRLLAQDVLSGPGAVVSWLAPTPWFAQLELAAQTIAPTDADTPELTGTARLLQYFSLGEASTLGVGLSAARRGEGQPGAFRDLGGADVYYRFRPLDTRAYLAVQGEVYLRKFRDVPGQSSAVENGWWGQAFWRASAYLGAGARYEEAPAAGESAPGTERRLALVGNWYPSEFSRLGLQLSQDWLPQNRTGQEVLLRFEFGIGAHGAHPF
jgi:hypothetical protein